MPKQFFYQVLGETLGPMSGVELRDKALAGEVRPDTLVRLGTEGDWVSASRLSNLFDAQGMALPHPKIQSAPNVDRKSSPTSHDAPAPPIAPPPLIASPGIQGHVPTSDQTAMGAGRSMKIVAYCTIGVVLMAMGVVAGSTWNSNKPQEAGAHGTGSESQKTEKSDLAKRNTMGEQEPFNAELFSQVHRAAMRFRSDRTAPNLRIVEAELGLIEHGAKTEREESVLKLFKLVFRAQRDTLVLETARKKLLENLAVISTEELHMISKVYGKSAEGVADKVLEEQEMTRQGYVAIAVKGKPQIMSHLAEWEFPRLETKYYSWTDYKKAITRLRAAEEFSLDSLGELLHNEGQLPQNKEGG